MFNFEYFLKAYIDQRRAKWNSMYTSNNYLNYNTNEFSSDLPSQTSFHNVNQQFIGNNSMKNDLFLLQLIAKNRFFNYELYSIKKLKNLLSINYLIVSRI